MYHLLFTTMLIVLVLPLSVSAAVKTQAKTAAKQVAKKDYNCADFKTHTEAQAFFIANGGPKKDPYRLDADKDGIACEKNK